MIKIIDLLFQAVRDADVFYLENPEGTRLI